MRARIFSSAVLAKEKARKNKQTEKSAKTAGSKSAEADKKGGKSHG